MTTHDQPSAEEVLGYFETLSNWGRWGADDRRGTLNHITDAVRRQALTLVTDGVTVSCALEISNFPQAGDLFGTPQRYMLRTGEGLGDLTACRRLRTASTTPAIRPAAPAGNARVRVLPGSPGPRILRPRVPRAQRHPPRRPVPFVLGRPDVQRAHRVSGDITLRRHRARRHRHPRRHRRSRRAARRR